MAREYNWNVKNKATKGYEVTKTLKEDKKTSMVCDTCRIISFRRSWVDGGGGGVTF